jgi:hypothetical protein
MGTQIDTGKSRPALYGLGRKMASGIQKFVGTTTDKINLKQTDEANFVADYQAAVEAEDVYQGARVERSNCIAARRGLEETVDRFIGRCKAMLAEDPDFGPRWNMNYLQLGFKAGSLELPSDNDGRLEILRSLAGFYFRNTGKEVPAIEVTSVKAGALEQELSAAISKIAECETMVSQASAAREAAEEALRKRIRIVIDELEFLLDPADPRWPSFGLNKPAETQRPETVENVQASNATPRMLSLDWDPAERASRYKVRVQVVGRDQDFETVTEVFDPHADLTFDPGTTVQVQIVAVNGAGESAPSQVIEKQILGQALAA